jgi:tRNA 2-thiouridine synthesizing protein B
MILHTVNKSPFERNALVSCLGHAQAGSSVLMIEDGVYGAIAGSQVADVVNNSLATVKIYVLEPDLAARGIAKEKLISGVQLIDYAGFVDLAADNTTVQAWL